MSIPRKPRIDTVLDSRYVEMDVVREREGCLNGSEVEGGMKKVQMRNGMCHKMHQSGAALKAIVRGEITRSDRRCIVYSVQFVMVSKCAHFLRIATPYLLTIVTNAARIETIKL